MIENFEKLSSHLHFEKPPKRIQVSKPRSKCLFKRKKPLNTNQNKHSINVNNHTIVCGVFFIPSWGKKFQ
jgi:hypothetical protein